MPVAEAKKRVLEALRDGAKVAEACALVQRSTETYRGWQKDDAAFADAVRQLRLDRAKTDEDGTQPVPDFATFCRDYLFEPLFEHQLRALDVLEGNAPRALHPSMNYEPGDHGRVLFNFPPNHAKTTSFSINYAVWLLHKDPNVKIAIVSKSQGFAKKILAGIKTRLTSNAYREMHQRFAPGGGWRDPDQSWTQTMIYVQGKDDGAKDPTVEAVGLGGQIYGGRFDVIICDDVIDNENAHRHADHVDWLMTILDSRLPPEGGLLMVLGTRIAATDLYSELRKLTDEDDAQFFSYLSQPAVLEYGPSGRKEDWVTLWPWTNCTDADALAELRCIRCMASDSDCACESSEVMWCKPRWTGAKLARKRFPLGERRWSLVWQQQQIPDDATFNQRAVEASINRQRRNGPLVAGGMGHPADGMNGLYVIGGLDPATVGHTAMIVIALDRSRRKRYVLDGYNAAGISPQTMRERVKLLTRQYNINEWVIERNAFQRFLTQDPELNAFLRERGCKLTEQYTTGNKIDPDFGVMSLAPLFDSCGEAPSNHGGGGWKRTPEKALIELPDDRTSGWCTELVKQLIMWEPSGLSQGTKTDLVMALWFPLDVDTPLWTGAGWKTMGTVVPGDTVATASGEMSSVVAVTPIERQPVYRVSFSDGTSLRATGNHRWRVEPVGKGGKTQPERWMSTDEIRTSTDFKLICVRNPKPLDGPDVDLPVDPYCLGAWLGDGSAQQGTMYAHDDDAPAMRWQFEQAGYGTTDQKRKQTFGVTGMRAGLVRAGVLNNKHVPGDYLHGSHKQRLALLQGLMDTDGTVTPGRSRAYFANTNKNLADSVKFLALSLGFRVDVQFYPSGRARNPQGEQSPTLPHWRILFTPDSTTPNPFRMPRKAERVDAYVSTKPHRRLVIKSIEPDGEADVRCITVEHDSHVFLAGADLIPTGNCEIATKRVLGFGQGMRTHLANRFATKSRLRKRGTVNIAELREASILEREAGE